MAHWRVGSACNSSDATGSVTGYASTAFNNREYENLNFETIAYCSQNMLMFYNHKCVNNLFHRFFPWGLVYGLRMRFHPSLQKAASTLLLPSILLCYRGNPHMPPLLNVLGPLAMLVEANGNQLTPVQSKLVHLVLIPWQIEEEVWGSVSMIGPI